MPVPELDAIRRPALELLANINQLTPLSEIYERLADQFELSDEERNEMLPSNTQRRWHNRVVWSCYDLFRAGALDRPVKGRYQINDFGKKLVEEAPAVIDRSYLRKVSPAFEEFVSPNAKPEVVGKSKTEPLDSDSTPEESIDRAVEIVEDNLRSELLSQLLTVDPYRFERVVLDLLFAMGYGGSREEAAQLTKKSNDEGIDGVINEDRLGLEVIYVQAKRWQGNVGRKEIQSFVGALAGQQANKGVFITTSDFGPNARDYAKSVSQKVILINGPRLADLMIEHNIGVSTTRTIALKRMDSDYFEES